MSSSELSGLATDSNGERYFVDIKDRDVYHKRMAGYHNIGGKRVPGTEHSIARLGEPNPNVVIPIEEAKMRLAMTDEMLKALNPKKGKKSKRGHANTNPSIPARTRVKRTDAERVAAEVARLGVNQGSGVIKGTRTRGVTAQKG